MPLALLLSPDDQAVNAITSVLEEMSVTCERPLDGVAAAKQLNSHNFDLVLVDCENLPAAKLIFDVCRRGNDGKNPVPIAIVNGHAGLPTAFRLGAELILTKPVAKDQARSTIRAAVNRVKKDQPATPAPTAEQPGIDTARTEASSAAGTSPESPSENKPSAMPAQVPAEGLTMAAAASSGGQSISAPPTIAASSGPVITMSAAAATAPDTASAPTETTTADKPQSQAVQLSDDRVLAEPEGVEAAPNAKPAALASLERQETGSKRSKGRGPLLALVLLALVASGLYAAWMTQPAFRTLTQSQIERMLALAGLAHPAQTATRAPIRVTPGAKPSPGSATTAPAPAPATPTSTESLPPSQAAAAHAAATNAAQPATAAPPAIATSPATGGANALAAARTTPTAIAQPSPASATPNPPPSMATPVANATPSDTTLSGNANKTDGNKTATVQNSGAQKSAEPKGPDAKNTATPSSDAGLSAWNAAVILSSAGAERRLIHSVAPTYPAEAHANRVEGTVVLKALIDEGGKVSTVQLVEGNAALAESAVNAVKQWHYRPYVREGRTVPFQTIVLIDFPRPERTF